MASSFNLNNWFFNHWFGKQQPNKPPRLSLPFASVGSGDYPSPNPEQQQQPPPNATLTANSKSKRRGKSGSGSGKKHERAIDRYFWECYARPDHRHHPSIDRLLTEDPFFDRREDAAPEEVEQNKAWWEEFRNEPLIQFLRRSEEFADNIHKQEHQENVRPYHRADRKLWKKLPFVPGPDGRPMPRKTIRKPHEALDKFWDFFKQFMSGLWGFQQRHYPTGRPIDFVQAVGTKNLENRYYDFIMRSDEFYYKDRLGRTRGPMDLIRLKTAWAAGIIDTHTFIWGEDMDEWAPIGMIYGMEKAIATWEVRLGAASTAVFHKLRKGIPPWHSLRGFEKKTYKQLQDEAIESKNRDMAVLKANGGIWPGVKIPTHALFLWASGTELTNVLEEDHMPNTYISKDLRYRLAEALPDLRPWHVLSVEQAMDHLTYRGQWYREPLCSYRTGPPYIIEWFRDYVQQLMLFSEVYPSFIRRLKADIAGFKEIIDVADDVDTANFVRRRDEKLAKMINKRDGPR